MVPILEALPDAHQQIVIAGAVHLIGDRQLAAARISGSGSIHKAEGGVGFEPTCRLATAIGFQAYPSIRGFGPSGQIVTGPVESSDRLCDRRRRMASPPREHADGPSGKKPNAAQALAIALPSEVRGYEPKDCDRRRVESVVGSGACLERRAWPTPIRRNARAKTPVARLNTSSRRRPVGHPIVPALSCTAEAPTAGSRPPESASAHPKIPTSTPVVYEEVMPSSEKN